MKRRDLLAHLTRHGCRFVREGGDHSIWENPSNIHPTPSRDRRIHGPQDLPPFGRAHSISNLSTSGIKLLATAFSPKLAAFRAAFRRFDGQFRGLTLDRAASILMGFQSR